MSCALVSYHRSTPYGPGPELRLHHRPRDWRIGARWGRANGRRRLWLHVPLLALEVVL